MAVLPTLLLILAALFVGAAVISAVVAWRAAREARSTLFPIVREEESLRAGRARIGAFLLIALAALFVGGWIATLGLTGAEPPVADAARASEPGIAFATETPAPGGVPPTTPAAAFPPAATLLETPTPEVGEGAAMPALPTETSAPTFTPVTVVGVTPTPTATPLPPTATPVPPTPTPTSPPTLTPTPTPNLAAIRVVSSKTRTPAPPEVRMGPIQFATGVTGDVEAVNPGQVFPKETSAIYAIYHYEKMKKGLPFKAVWYQNGIEVLRDESEWTWGAEARSYSYLKTRGEGLYKLELYVNDSVMATGLFELR